MLKLQKPGQWLANKGGIAALYKTPAAFKKAKEAQLDLICKEFQEVVRVPISAGADVKFQAGWKWNRRLRDK